MTVADKKYGKNAVGEYNRNNDVKIRQEKNRRLAQLKNKVGDSVQNSQILAKASFFAVKRALRKIN